MLAGHMEMTRMRAYRRSVAMGQRHDQPVGIDVVSYECGQLGELGLTAAHSTVQESGRSSV
jgi:hypothetical protein